MSTIVESFFIVVREDDHHMVRHGVYDMALAEIRRLARKEGKGFYLLHAIEYHRTEQVEPPVVQHYLDGRSQSASSGDCNKSHRKLEHEERSEEVRDSYRGRPYPSRDEGRGQSSLSVPPERRFPDDG